MTFWTKSHLWMTQQMNWWCNELNRLMKWWCLVGISNQSHVTTCTNTKQALSTFRKTMVWKRERERKTVLRRHCIFKKKRNNNWCKHIWLIGFCSINWEREREKVVQLVVWCNCVFCGFAWFVWYSYPWAEALFVPPSWVFGVKGGTGDPPDSSDGVFDKNRLPPSSDTSVIGELY